MMGSPLSLVAFLNPPAAHSLGLREAVIPGGRR
jgi:hypothetical protein